MLQHDEHFHDDVKLVLVYSLLTRVMLKNLQRSPIGKNNYPTLMKQAFAWFSQLRQKEIVFTDSLPAVKEFVRQHLTLDNELETEWLDSVAELTFYIITHAKDANLHETISSVTNRSYFKGALYKAFIAGVSNMDDDNAGPEFEDWYNQHYNGNSK